MGGHTKESQLDVIMHLLSPYIYLDFWSHLQVRHSSSFEKIANAAIDRQRQHHVLCSQILAQKH